MPLWILAVAGPRLLLRQKLSCGCAEPLPKYCTVLSLSGLLSEAYPEDALLETSEASSHTNL